MQLHPDYPVVEDAYQMTKEWTVTLPTRFNRRMEEGDLVIWKPGFTIWTVVWGNDQNLSQEERLVWIKDESSPSCYDEITEESDGITRYAYRLKEYSEDDRLPAFYCYAFGNLGHVQMAIYFDSEEDIADAMAIWRSLAES
ncbi:hypothetical protein Rhal01_03407 [Rubritalea halochordaticola]|uniref:DUF4367 domain-containing protein n=1 Tax=Rubritalea halochordaticola TaxID=714537 RepID=A0ABP9V5R0_9BACT